MPPSTASDLRCGLDTYRDAMQRATGAVAVAGVGSPRPGLMAAALYASEPYDLRAPGLPVARLSINLSAAETVGGLDGDRPQRLRADRHTLYLTPAHAGARWRKDVPTEHINLYFDPQDGDAAAGVPASGAGVASGVPRLNVSLRGMSPVIDALEQELRAGDAFSPEAIDSWGRLLLIALARGPGAGASAQADPLRGATMRRLQDHVQAHLSQRLLIADLAALVDLPPQVFAAAFVRRTGRTPHQFVLAQRVIRARELLCGTGQPIAEVALACGFSSQSHLTRVLTERLGHSPQVLRQSQP